MSKWTISYYDQSVANQVERLPKRVIGKYLRLADLIEEYGPNLGMPHTKAMGGGLFELRIATSEQSVRAFFCTMVKKEIIILNIIAKKSQKTPKQALEMAKKRMKEVQSE